MITFNPIGTVVSDVTVQTDKQWGKTKSKIVIKNEYSSGLIGLSEFSHIIVVYYLHEAKFIKEKDLQRRPQGRDDMPLVGIFSQRAKNRPNPIGVTSVRLLEVKDNVITVEGLDAICDTPVLDIKPYYPSYDKKQDVSVPDWVNVLMKEYF
ncbi:tRNA (N6-threonylcarbamoyladenosine(37)-N6)-methyltransferase TrmO [Mobilitalea sibirica]|uniref:tRNA (N6-threonylcarbamoyladenosine(37)-N6)-methyltransferase TrmO n=1 Tax=Mobilitalea sibirica TaxID=1462919 RepID=A0A8J7H166_9FIRM|nr:tRNA (N6-threonylcarbamoyladenosine(37)-N6)-methyltransferase TrmO [Mobilitalea sibirica]MBH1940048.1 tRNA (N6-threonylcarbamoyladenosine(37)-N6)-methyltransferase TrmO [Mobilitalea sibirica]